MNDRAALRNIRLRLAILTGLLSKTAGFFLQVVSLPIASVALGNSGFAVYAMLTAIISWLMLSSVGIGYALTIRVSAGRGTGDYQIVRISFSTGVWLTLALAVIIVLTAVAVYRLSGIGDSLFEQYAALQGDIFWSLVIILVAFFLLTNTNVIEAMQLGFQEQHQFNLYSFAGSGVAGVAVYLVAQHHDVTPSAILLAVQGPFILARLANSAHFLMRHPEFLPRPSLVDPLRIRGLVWQGLQFSVAATLNNFMAHFFPILVIGATMAAADAAAFAAVMNSIVIATSFYAIVMRPQLGAVPEALAAGDRSWIRRTFSLFLAVNLGYAVIFCTAYIVVGQWIFAIWYRGSIAPSAVLLASAGAYMLSLSVELTVNGFLAGIGQIRLTAISALAKAVSLCVFIGFSVEWGGDYVVFVILLTHSLVFAVIPLTLKFLLLMRKP